MVKIATQSYIRIPKGEYVRLKRLEKHFGGFWSYFERLRRIAEARKDIQTGKTVPQEKLFDELGI